MDSMYSKINGDYHKLSRAKVNQRIDGALATTYRWQKHAPPYLPQLANLTRVFPVVDKIKAEFGTFLEEAIGYFFISRSDLRQIASVKLWKLALCVHRYGAIYFLSRREARDANVLACDNSTCLNKIGMILAENNLYNKLINYAICAWVHAFEERKNYSEIRLPRNAIMSKSSGAIFVNKKDFDGFFPENAFASEDPLYDLHDFAHYLCASISSELYGCKYFSHFSHLEQEIQALIRDNRYTDINPTVFGDSLIFRQLSLGIFDRIHNSADSDEQIVSTISIELARYMRAEIGLLQPKTGQIIHAPKALGARALAALSQNKAYEHTAAECEELMFIRGAPLHMMDILSQVGTSERVKMIGDLPLQYHERRNFLRHRAQKRAYFIHACYLREKMDCSPEDTHLLDLVISNLTFSDYLSGARNDLYEII